MKRNSIFVISISVYFISTFVGPFALAQQQPNVLFPHSVYKRFHETLSKKKKKLKKEAAATTAGAQSGRYLEASIELLEIEFRTEMLKAIREQDMQRVEILQAFQVDFEHSMDTLVSQKHDFHGFDEKLSGSDDLAADLSRRMSENEAHAGKKQAATASRHNEEFNLGAVSSRSTPPLYVVQSAETGSTVGVKLAHVYAPRDGEEDLLSHSQALSVIDPNTGHSRVVVFEDAEQFAALKRVPDNGVSPLVARRAAALATTNLAFTVDAQARAEAEAVCHHSSSNILAAQHLLLQQHTRDIVSQILTTVYRFDHHGSPAFGIKVTNRSNGSPAILFVDAQAQPARFALKDLEEAGFDSLHVLQVSEVPMDTMQEFFSILQSFNQGKIAASKQAQEAARALSLMPN